MIMSSLFSRNDYEMRIEEIIAPDYLCFHFPFLEEILKPFLISKI